MSAQLSTRDRLTIGVRMGATPWAVKLALGISALAWAILLALIARGHADAAALYRDAGLVWVVLGLICASLAFQQVGDEFANRDELRCRLLPAGRTEWLWQTLVTRGCEVAAAWVIWAVYVLLAGIGFHGAPALAGALVAPLGALAVASLLGVVLATLFQGPVTGWGAYAVLVLSLVGLRGTTVAVSPLDGWEQALAASPWCASERLLRFVLGMPSTGPGAGMLVGTVAAWLVGGALVLVGAWRWRLSRVSLAGTSVRQRRLRYYRGM
ncbi:hypothetical protein H8R18_06785 [Nanchangia anserum]|uniref:Uncharacterized protein n=1 Tax=Nanchangia anserum TaxID=2692125 RepID=A0A8I0GCW5_9ACTO|nr:hypothetical protein [Nanchangia anserum]MBD3689238.1 hypothetical protein [Nanchangia anserum]QOX81459.1 hypothetical protein H8R18_06785 [Nanchangia anserum]